ncbi:MAG: hypothetical protein ACPH5P_00255 [Akkermansiaceae bacterium]
MTSAISELKECKLCATTPIIWYEPGATIIECKCKKTARPDDREGSIEHSTALAQWWNTMWWDSSKKIEYHE